MKLLIAVIMWFALSGCTDKREELHKKQEKLLREQSSKWTEEQKNYRLPELGTKNAPKKSDQKGTTK